MRVGSAHSVRVSRQALSLLAVLLVAKGLVLALAGLTPTWTSPAVFFWQDGAVVLVWACVDLLTARARISWIAYGLAVAYVAINVPVTTILGSPLTGPMLHAARGALSDSVTHYLTPANLLLIAAVGVTGGVAPRLISRDVMVPRWGAMILVVSVAAAAAVTPSYDTRGLERNALTTLVRWPRIAVAAAPTASWRDSLNVSEAPTETASSSADLSTLRGAARGMNVVVVILESAGAQYLGAYGAAPDPMPVLGGLAASSLVFDAAYAVYPESVKGLYATLCGRSPQFGVSLETMIETGQALCEPPAQALGAAGYATALFHSGRFGYLGMDALLATQRFDVLEDAGAIGGRVQSSFGVDEASTVRRLLAWTARSHAQPFFAVYMPAAGHHPYAANVPGPFPVGSDLDRYRNALHECDQALGALIDGLREQGTLDRTMVVIFGDHGEAFGQHPGNVGHTLFIHDENVRVPFIIRIPGVTSGRRVASPVSLLDAAPTVLDLVGLPVPQTTEGRSLLEPGARIAPFFADYSLGWLGLRDGCWKYQLNLNASRSSLFDVCRDPSETRDLAAGHQARVADYRARLTGWR